MLIKIILLLGLLSSLARADTGPGFKQYCQNEAIGGGNASLVITCQRPTTPGSLLVLFTRLGASTTGTWSVTDPLSQTWTPTASGYSNDASFAPRSRMDFIANSGSISTVTINFSPDANSPAGIMLEFSGMATSSVEDSSVNSNSAGVAATSGTSGSLTTTHASDVLVFGVALAGAAGVNCPFGFMVGSGWSGEPPPVTRACVQYKIVGTTQTGVTTSMGWANSVASSSVFAGFKAL